MVSPAPQVDTRTPADIAAQVRDLLKAYTPDWHEFDPASGRQDRLSGALIGIFARYAEIIIQRLNQAPDKNLLAFLDLLGTSLLPPQQARVPLTFSLASGSATDTVVPAGTQAAAPPAEGETNPVIFETERELVVTAAQLASVFVRDPEQDTYADYSAVIASPASPGVPVFKGNRSIDHVLYLGHSLLLGLPYLQNLRLIFTLASALQDERKLKWEFWNGTWQETGPKDSTSDQTLNLAQSGTIDLGSLPPVPTGTVNRIDSRWLRCTLVTPITRLNQAVLGMVRESQLPQVSQVKIEAHLLRPVGQGLAPDLAFTNTAPIDLGKDFFPFGEKPRQNDALYLASAEAFSKDQAGNLAGSGATVNLAFQVANSHLIPATGSVRPSPDLELAWECWNGTSWQVVGASRTPGWLSLLELDPVPSVGADQVIVQGTAQRGAAVIVDAASVSGKPASVGDNGRFAVQVSLAPGLNVITLTASYLGRSTKAWAVVVQPAVDTLKQKPIRLVPQAPGQPVADDRVKIGVSVIGDDGKIIQNIRVTNGSSGTAAQAPLGNAVEVALVEGRNDLLIEGLDAQGARQAATTLVCSRVAAPANPANIPGFADGTHAFCQSGTVTLTLPDAVDRTAVNAQNNYWLRVRITKGEYGKEAAYLLKNPLSPGDGYMLILANFQPPVISGVRIGYEQTLSDVPQVCLVQNNSNFDDLTVANQAGSSPFAPFRAAPEDRPTLYLGFTLPAGLTTFPNRTLSLYTRTDDVKYGERAVPIAPVYSQEFGALLSTVSHRFWVTNAAPQAASLQLSILGTQWPTVVNPPQLQLGPGESGQVLVQVTLPQNVPLGNSDRGFLELVAGDPPLEFSATFVTIAGTEPPAAERLQLGWEYWNGTAWDKLTVRDDSENFNRSGLVEFLTPVGLSSRTEFGLNAYWLRVVWQSGEYINEPKLRRLLLNTTMAEHSITILNEILGSSTAGKNLTLSTTRTPILLGQQLEVQEPEMPSAEEQAIIEGEEGESAISIVADAAGRPQEIWVRWHAVPDFYGSGPRDRHYMLDHLSGEVRFGDGSNGRIPPVGAGNLRMASYKVGGGSSGNKPAGVITQLKTTVPYIDRVTNPEPAIGGAEAETHASMLERAPRAIRHRGRAVTLEDYQDLAMLASPEVARARCVSVRNLVDDPLDTTPSVPGALSIIIVPRSTDPKPLPSLDLIARVQAYIEANNVPTATVALVGPLYVRVQVVAEIALSFLEGASAVEQAVLQRLTSFLHPLTGGWDGAGWAFGREPHKSDLYALIEAVPGVDHVRVLDIVETDDPPGAKNTGRFLVYSGAHKLSLVYGIV